MFMRKVTKINDGWSFFKGPYKNGKVPKKAKRNFEMQIAKEAE